MSKVAVVTDSTATIPMEILERLGKTFLIFCHLEQMISRVVL